MNVWKNKADLYYQTRNITKVYSSHMCFSAHIFISYHFQGQCKFNNKTGIEEKESISVDSSLKLWQTTMNHQFPRLFELKREKILKTFPFDKFQLEFDDENTFISANPIENSKKNWTNVIVSESIYEANRLSFDSTD